MFEAYAIDTTCDGYMYRCIDGRWAGEWSGPLKAPPAFGLFIVVSVVVDDPAGLSC